jgi:hypothetical protein
MEAPSPDIIVTIAGRQFPLRARVGGILRLLALHESAITSSPSVKLTIDCGPSEIALSITSKVGKQKVRC